MSDDRELLTLTEVSNRTGISMPTLQRYKKEFQDRIPSEGEGRRQRYPEESLEVFQQIKKENIKKRGRPRKSGSQKKSSSSSGSSAGKPEKARSDLLTLKEVGERSGISYPTLVRYVKEHADRIPFEGEGRRRRYHPEAVPVFEKIRAHRGKWPGDDDGASSSATSSSSSSSKGSTKGDPSVARRVRALEKSQEKLEKQVKDLLRELKKPMTVTLSRK